MRSISSRIRRSAIDETTSRDHVAEGGLAEPLDDAPRDVVDERRTDGVAGQRRRATA